MPEGSKGAPYSTWSKQQTSNRYIIWKESESAPNCFCRYGGEHLAPELQKEAIYGLTEIYRDQIRSARLVANPGCYPTSVQLPLFPLLQARHLPL